MTISRAFAHTILAYAERGLDVQESVDRVTTFMERRGLAHFLPTVAEELERMLTNKRTAETLRVYTPYSLAPELIASIEKAYGGTEYTTEEIIDESLIGGFRAERAYRYFDATVAHALKRLRQHLLQN